MKDIINRIFNKLDCIVIIVIISVVFSVLNFYVAALNNKHINKILEIQQLKER